MLSYFLQFFLKSFFWLSLSSKCCSSNFKEAVLWFFLLIVALVQPLYRKSLSTECCWDAHSSRSSVRVSVEFLVTSIIKALFFPPSCWVWPDGQIMNSPSPSKIILFYNYRGHSATRNLQSFRNDFISWILYLCLNHSFIKEVYREFICLHDLVYVLTCSVNCGTLYTCVLCLNTMHLTANWSHSKESE